VADARAPVQETRLTAGPGLAEDGRHVGYITAQLREAIRSGVATITVLAREAGATLEVLAERMGWPLTRLLVSIGELESEGRISRESGVIRLREEHGSDGQAEE